MVSTLLMVLETLAAGGPALAAVFVAALILSAALIATILGRLADPEPFPVTSHGDESPCYKGEARSRLYTPLTKGAECRPHR